MKYTFAINEIPSGPVDGTEIVQEDVNSAAVADRATSLAIAGGVDPLDTIKKVDYGDTAATLKIKQETSSSATTVFQQSLSSGNVTIEELQAAVLQASDKEEVQQELEDFFIEQGILVDGIDYTVTDLRYTTNIMIAEQLFRDRISAIEEETGFLGKVGDWVDRYLIRQMPIGMVEDITRRSERKGEDLLQAALTMNPKEYKAFISNYIEELAEEGVLSSNNLFALQDGFQEALNAGYDPMAGLNQLLAIGEAIPLVKGAGKAARAGANRIKTIGHADHAITRVTALEGQEAGAEAAEKAIKATNGMDNVAKTKAGPAAFDEGSSIVRPQSAKVLEIAEENNLWRKIRELDTKGTFGRVLREDQLETAGAKVQNNLKKRTTNKFNNYTFLTDIANNNIARVDFGNTKKGTPYVRQADAEKALRKSDLEEGYVAQVDPNDSTKGYVIRVDTRIDPTEYVDAFDENSIEFGLLRENLARVLGSNASLDEEYLSGLANMGEAGLSLVKESAKDLEKSIRSIPTDSKRAIVRVFKELRDGADAEIKTGYTQSEFVDKFKELHPKGKVPTQADLKAYNALIEFEDAGWLMRSNEALNRYVKKGYWSLELPDGKAIGKKVDEVPEGELVLNVSTGTLVDDPANVPTGIWRLDTPHHSGRLFITNPSDVKVLDHADVMGFNAGGRRINPKANYFVVLDGEQPRAFLTAFSEKQARFAVQQFENIQKKIKELGGDLRKITATDELDNIIRANNDWNPSITSFDEFADFAKTRNLSFDSPVSYKERGGEVVNISKDSPHAGAKWDDYVKVQLNRSDEVLLDYGGSEAYNIDPVSAIMQEFSNSATHYTHRSYTYNAAAAWVKRAARKGSGVKLSDSFPADDYLNQVQHAEITGNSEVARRMRTQRAIIRRRLKMKGPVERRFESFGQEVREAIFGVTGVKLDSLDPTNTLLNIGFQSAFGFMNISQFFMQSMHATTIMALSPKQGFKGASATIPLRMALNAGTPSAQKLAIRRMAKHFGETEETIAELVEYVRTSGRDIIGGDTMELGTGTSFGISNWGGESILPSAMRDALSRATSGGRKVLDAGLIPFNQGERLSRMTGINTAFFEFKQKFPNISALSDEGRRWITAREQNLTFNMTATSRPMFQNGLMKVPTQWLSYSFRAAESVILGRGFTVAERARLAAVLMPMYGLTGMGLGSFADYVTEKLGIEDPELYIGMKYGLIDYLISEITPAETALASRLAPITAFTDLYNDIIGGEASVLEIVGGPSGQITSGIFGQLAESMSELFNGHTVSLTEDVLQVLRQPSGLDNIAKGIGILNNGFYRSKTGTVLPIEMKTSDALISFMGFSPLEVSEFYSQKSGKFNSDKKLRSFTKDMRKDYQRALMLYREDSDRGLAMMKEIHVKIALSGFSSVKQMEIRRGLKDISSVEVYYLVRDLLERDKRNSALLVEELLGGN